MPFLDDLALFLVPRLAWGYLRLIGATSSIVWRGTEKRDKILREEGNLIYAFWHGRQSFLPWAYRGWEDIHNLVSKSKDGELIARVIDYSGMKTVRGSSSRGGMRALIELKHKLEEGKSMAITPDGPKGPQRSVHSGVLYLAQKTGKKILPVAVSYKRRAIFRGWDDYWVPLPFNRFVVCHGSPVQISETDSIDLKSEELKSNLNQVTEEADAFIESQTGSWSETLVYFFYNLAWIIFSPFILFGIFLRYPKTFLKHFFDGFAMRFGNFMPGKASIWVHAASLGECRAALPLVQALRAKYPKERIIFSSTTVNGIAEAQKLHLGDEVIFSPLDLPWSLNAAFKAFEPRLLLLLESEIWPNWLKAAQSRGVTVGIVNGRISPRSARRYMRVRSICKVWMRKIDFVCAREKGDADRFGQIGIPPERITVSGNLKFDLFPWNLNGSLSEKKNPAWPESETVMVAGSIREGEEVPVLDGFLALKKKFPSLKLVLAPRHMDQNAALQSLAQSRSFKTALRSENFSSPSATSSWDVLLWDTFGDLWQAYRDAAVVFVGGSLVPMGGQNPIEPAFFGKPVLFGLHMDNFEEPARALLAAGGGIQVMDASGLAVQVEKLLSDVSHRRRVGELAKKVVGEVSGKATQATLRDLELHFHA